MIYRALECAIRNDTSWDDWYATVWFEATPETKSQRLEQLLSTAWRVSADQLCTGNVDELFEIERNSVQPREAGDRRWHETGSHGNRPSYYAGQYEEQLYFLHPEKARKIREAQAAAGQHAVELAENLKRELAELPTCGPGDHALAARIRDIHFEIDQYLAFAERSGARSNGS